MKNFVPIKCSAVCIKQPLERDSETQVKSQKRLVLKPNSIPSNIFQNIYRNRQLPIYRQYHILARKLTNLTNGFLLRVLIKCNFNESFSFGI